MVLESQARESDVVSHLAAGAGAAEDTHIPDDKSGKSAEYDEVEGQEIQPPDGGFRAWSVVLGAWCVQFVAYGIGNSFGTFQSYYSEHQLVGLSADTVSWIGSLQLFLLLFGGSFVGPLFDAYGARWLVFSGSVLYIFSFFILSACRRYYQFIIVHGILLGIASTLMFHPAMAATSHYFDKRKALAMGIVVTGGGVGGVVLPLLLSNLFEKLGYGWTIRVLAFIFLAFLIVANLTIKALLPPRKPTPILQTFQGLKEANLVLLTAGSWFFSLGLITPYFFLPGYAQVIGSGTTFSLYCITFLSVGSVVGRVVMGFFSDRLGRFNVFVACLLISGILVLAMWLHCTSTATLIAFAVLFGFFTGGCESLVPACAGQISSQRMTGNRLGLMWAIGSFASLVSGPIGGALVAHSSLSGHEGYSGAIIFSGVAFFISAVCILASRLATDRRIFAVV
ncbi:hypothetical protein BOTBODRAFT_162565 [Botryobasidium botryosum FD-172 SS1]|uniref:Major facilitator superfamily (MFS) profile domain-containing protein n=1 Tax=Botryobasidium botryosum (strain FD-172 SS1) TaxID=930990 RepID=A0A067M7I8_BOTB1|nr:hypothetical protein BOTBODRAFT_162565 [Botryobasidium botryosum FD-172 SS1]